MSKGGVGYADVDDEWSYLKMESHIDLKRLCRMCAEACTISTSIDVFIPSPKLASQLLHYFGILLVENDGMPTRICQGCICELDRWEEVKSSIQRGQDFLFKQLDNLKTTDSNETHLDIFDENPSDLPMSDAELFHELSLGVSFDKTLKNPNVSENVENPQELSLTLPEDSSTPSVSIIRDTFTCKICGSGFKNCAKYLQHKAFHSFNGKIMKMTKKQTLANTKHRPKRPVSPTHPYCCGVCSEKFKKQMTLAQHLHDHFKENKFQKVFPCAHCKIIFKNISLLVKHQKKHLTNPDVPFGYSCLKCDKQFLSSANLKIHMRTHQDVFGFECSICDSKFKYKTLLVDHITKIHPDLNTSSYSEKLLTSKSPTCGLCLVNFNTFKDLAFHLNHVHKSLEHNSNSFPCGNCNSSFKSIVRLVKHFPSHIIALQAKTSKCEFCLRKFNDVEKVQSHIKKNHSKLKPFHDCSFCKIIFMDLSALKEHVQTNHVNKSPNKLVTSVVKDKPNFEVQDKQVGSVFIQSSQMSVTKNELTSVDSIGVFDPFLNKNKNINETYFNVTEENYCLHDKNNDDLMSESKELDFFCRHCGTNFENFNSFSRHVERELQNHNFINCGICMLLFYNFETFHQHIANHHIFPEKTVSIECGICFRKFTDKQIYNTHLKFHADHKRFKCRTCNVDFKFKQSWKKHFNSEHCDYEGDEDDLLVDIAEPKELQINETQIMSVACERSANYSCGVCLVAFNDISSFSNHIQEEFHNLKKKQIPCYLCKSVFRKHDSLVKHTIQHLAQLDKTNSYQCTICFKRFHDKNKYNSHMFVHTNLMRFKCKLCENRYRSKFPWKLHFKSHHSDFVGEEKDALEIIPIPSNNGNTENVTDNPVSVSKIETKNKQINETTKNTETVEHYSCDICNERFFSSILLYQHLIGKHITEYQVNCDICSQLFTSADQLQSHLEIHTKVRKFFCPVCNKCFKSSCTLRDHSYLHSTDRPFACTLCDRRYRARNALYYHTKRDHEKRKNVMCEICSKLFLHKCDLKKHMFTHTGISCYSCEICGKYFNGLSKLREHAYVHNDEKPLHCVKCNKGFVYSKNWRLHMRKNCQVPEDQIPYTRPRFAKTEFIDTSNKSI